MMDKNTNESKVIDIDSDTVVHYGGLPKTALSVLEKKFGRSLRLEDIVGSGTGVQQGMNTVMPVLHARDSMTGEYITLRFPDLYPSNEPAFQKADEIYYHLRHITKRSGRQPTSIRPSLERAQLLLEQYFKTPAHYGDSNANDPIGVLAQNDSEEAYIGFLKGNVMKYAMRIGKKGSDMEDAGKLLHYAALLTGAIDYQATKEEDQ